MPSVNRPNHRQPNYPATVAEVLDDTMTFKPAVLAAMRDFRRANPWAGSLEERKAKMIALHILLSRAYEMTPPQLAFAEMRGSAMYLSRANLIVMDVSPEGNLSVVTYLHEFGHARGWDERQTCKWSINLFKRIFPRQFERLEQDGHRLVRPRLALVRPAADAGVPAVHREQRVTVRTLRREAGRLPDAARTPRALPGH